MRRWLWLPLLCSACMVGPDYQKPDAPIPVTYKELQGWTIAQPQDAVDRGDWWSIYHDPLLDALEQQVDVCVQQTGRTRVECREDIRRGNLTGPP